MKYFIFSDTHRGNGKRSDDFGLNDRKLVKFIDKQNADKNILDGDGDDTHQTSWKKIRKVHYETEKRFNEDDFILLRGNHDKRKFGADYLTFITNSNKKVWVEHLHEGDWLVNIFIVKWWNHLMGHTIEKIWPGVDNPDEFNPDKENRADRKSEERAIKLFKEGNDIVFGGHTHKFLKKKFIIDGRECWYCNCGHCMHGQCKGFLIDTETDEIIKVANCIVDTG